MILILSQTRMGPQIHMALTETCAALATALRAPTALPPAALTPSDLTPNVLSPCAGHSGPASAPETAGRATALSLRVSCGCLTPAVGTQNAAAVSCGRLSLTAH